MNKRIFKYTHPLISLLFFVSIVAGSFICKHPLFIIVNLCCGYIFYCSLNNRIIFKPILYILPFLLFFSIINILVSHQGITILFYIFDNPITLESFLYGLFSSLSLMSIIIWFLSFSLIIDGDKIIMLFGKILPTISLLISMILRLIPLYTNYINKFSDYNKQFINNQNRYNKIKNSIYIIVQMIAFTVENSLQTVDSMKARAYGIQKRSNYHENKFKLIDFLFLFVIIFIMSFIIKSMLFGNLKVSYYPFIRIGFNQINLYFILVLYIVITLMPVYGNKIL